MTEDPVLYSVKQAAHMLGISRSLAYELVATGELRSGRIRGKLLLKPKDLEAFVSSLAYTRAAGSVGREPERSSRA